MEIQVRRGGKGARQGHRSSGILYVALSTCMVVLIAALAITASQTPPPAIAELAPEAQEQIKDPPPEQSSELGSAEGGQGLGGLPSTTTTALPGAAPTTSAAPLRVPRVRKCVGNPPRQTEDPQSPPCVPFWEGDNGGATSKGVSREEIRIALPGEGSKDKRHTAALEAYFNSRYELYGRRLRFVYFKDAGNFASCTAMKADAVRVDTEIKAFASLFYSAQGGRETCYYDELAKRGIISSQSSFLGIPSATEADLVRTGPYQWNYYPALDTVLRNVGEIVCKQLKGRPATLARPPTAIRSFGVIVNTNGEGARPPNPEPMLAEAGKCGATFTKVEADLGPQGANTDAVRRSIVYLKDQGVTTVVCLCLMEVFKPLMATANTETYYPEWFVQNFQKQDDDHSAICCEADQASQVFGLRTWNRSQPREMMPYWQAIREVDPTYPPTQLNFSVDYWSLLLLASGIQAAGPNLNPQTFEQGLQRLVFPNPSCGGPPLYQACVGFKGDHTMIDDFALIYWDPNGKSNEYDYRLDTNAVRKQQGQGAFCYVDRGQRHHAGQWPAGDPAAFRATCA
jgi:hypothetical protein